MKKTAHFTYWRVILYTPCRLRLQNLELAYMVVTDFIQGLVRLG
jgi:hypothetical protein